VTGVRPPTQRPDHHDGREGGDVSEGYRLAMLFDPYRSVVAAFAARVGSVAVAYQLIAAVAVPARR